MRVLALDTATEACSAAVLDDDAVVGTFVEMGRGHAEEILGMIDRVLSQAGVALQSLDGIAASVGPGAFTGVRISVSVAQGLAFGAGLPVAAVSTLEALALQALRGAAAGEDSPNDVLVCLDARMGEVYWGCFSGDPVRGVTSRGVMAVGIPGSVRVPFAGRFVGIGRGFAVYPGLAQLEGIELPPRNLAALPDARDMARIGRLRFESGEGVDPAALLPVYLRDKVAFTEAERARLKRATVHDP